MAEWMGHVARWLMLLAERIGDYVVRQDLIWTDHTPIRTLTPGNGKTRVSRVWCYTWIVRRRGSRTGIDVTSPQRRIAVPTSRWLSVLAGLPIVADRVLSLVGQARHHGGGAQGCG